MPILLFEKWQKDVDMLILEGKSIGNSQTIEFADTLFIESVSADKPVLKRGGNAITYSRKR